MYKNVGPKIIQTLFFTPQTEQNEALLGKWLTEVGIISLCT